METIINCDDKINILLVDDSPENIFTLESILEKTTRNFLHAESGNEALMMAKIEPVATENASRRRAHALCAPPLPAILLVVVCLKVVVGSRP